MVVEVGLISYFNPRLTYRLYINEHLMIIKWQVMLCILITHHKIKQINLPVAIPEVIHP